MSYLDRYLEPKVLKETVAKGKQLLKNWDFDTIAVRGNSGLLVGAPLAMAMGKNLAIVRKSIKNCHSENLVEGWGKDQKIVLVDDFIETGKTLRQMYSAIFKRCDNPTIVGIFLFAEVDSEQKEAVQISKTLEFPAKSIYRYAYLDEERVGSA